MRRIGLVTSSRADWGIQRSTAQALAQRDDVQLEIVACGMHLSPACGHTVEQIEADGFQVSHRVDCLEDADTPAAIGTAMGNGTAAFASLFETWRPDLLTVLGDRFDMFPAALAAVPHQIPLAHLHGGELTHGAIDDALRHALTKFAHLHLATEAYARRIRQLGEPAEAIHVVGAAGLDDLLALDPLDDDTLQAEFGFTPSTTNLLVAYHPETRQPEAVGRDAAALFSTLQEINGPAVVIRPNADTGNRAIHAAIDALVTERRATRAFANLDRRAFLSLMRQASVMVGNSSSGIIEAPSFALPVVNVGDRQAGRVRDANVIDCSPTTDAVRSALRAPLAPEFRAGLAGMVNPYGDGRSGPRIAELLATADLSALLTAKRFVDLP